MIKKLFLLFIIAGNFIACSNEKVETKNNEPEADHDKRLTHKVTLTEVQIKTAGIEIGTIEQKNLETSIRANGMLSVPNQNKAFITSVNSGVIRSLLIQPGSFVRKGQAVATIVNPNLAGLQQQLQTVNAQLSLAEIEYTRQKELVAGNAAPLKNLQRVETELATLRVTRNSLQKQLVAMGISITSVNKGEIVTTLTVSAPISGTVSNVNANIGSPIDVSTPIAEIVNNSQLHLDLFVYEKDLPSVRANQIIHFTLTNSPGKEYDAQVFSIGTAFASESKTIPIHAIVKGDKTGLIEGMNITALVSIGEALLPAVPTDAIVNFQGQDYIFVKLPANSTKISNQEKDSTEKKLQAESTVGTVFERVAVVKGVSDIGYTAITLLNNLPVKTQIITKGAFFALAKMTNIEE